MKELQEELLLRAQRRYVALEELLRLTREIEQCMQRNDRVSLKLLLEMRGKEMETANKINHEIRLLMECCPDEQAEHMALLMKGVPVEPGSFEEEKTGEICERTKRVLDILKDVDRKISIRLAGSDSFYHTDKL